MPQSGHHRPQLQYVVVLAVSPPLAEEHAPAPLQPVGAQRRRSARGLGDLRAASSQPHPCPR
eukprot:4445772-Pyramimonas_sp.AAC.1